MQDEIERRLDEIDKKLKGIPKGQQELLNHLSIRLDAQMDKWGQGIMIGLNLVIILMLGFLIWFQWNIWT